MHDTNDLSHALQLKSICDECRYFIWAFKPTLHQFHLAHTSQEIINAVDVVISYFHCKHNLPHLSQGKVNYVHVGISSASYDQCHVKLINHICHKEQIIQVLFYI